MQVCGWARADPLSCILLNQKDSVQPKKEATDKPVPWFADPTLANENLSPNAAEHHCDSQTGHRNACKKPTSTNPQAESLCIDASMEALRLNEPDSRLYDALQNSTLLKRLEEEGFPKEASFHPHLPLKASNKTTKTKKSKHKSKTGAKKAHKTNNTLVPITNFTVTMPEPPSGGKKAAPKKAK